jgi:hypothetical protein
MIQITNYHLLITIIFQNKNHQFNLAVEINIVAKIFHKLFLAFQLPVALWRRTGEIKLLSPVYHIRRLLRKRGECDFWLVLLVGSILPN